MSVSLVEPVFLFKTWLIACAYSGSGMLPDALSLSPSSFVFSPLYLNWLLITLLILLWIQLQFGELLSNHHPRQMFRHCLSLSVSPVTGAHCSWRCAFTFIFLLLAGVDQFHRCRSHNRGCHCLVIWLRLPPCYFPGRSTALSCYFTRSTSCLWTHFHVWWAWFVTCLMCDVPWDISCCKWMIQNQGSATQNDEGAILDKNK